MATMATTATTATTATHIESKSATATATFELKDTIQPGVTAPKTLQPVVSSSKPVVSPK
jgi:hypothetical protein